MYQLIYDFINDYLLGTMTTSDIYAPQLCMILTHVSIVLIYVVGVLFIIWMFKLVAGLFRW